MLPFTTHTVTVINRGTTLDAYNNRVPDLRPSAATVSVVPAVVEPGGSGTARASKDRAQTLTRARFYLPAGTTVTSESLIEWDGRRYTVDGDPESWSAAAGGLAHLVVNGTLARG